MGLESPAGGADVGAQFPVKDPVVFAGVESSLISNNFVFKLVTPTSACVSFWACLQLSPFSARTAPTLH
jgi:hypothetical protein